MVVVFFSLSPSLSVSSIGLFGRTQSPLCHVPPPSPSSSLSLSLSLSSALAALRPSEYWQCEAHRATAWTWRCLGSVTRDATQDATASSGGAARGEDDSGTFLLTFSSKKCPPLLSRSPRDISHWIFFAGGWDSDLAFAGSAWLVLPSSSGRGDYREMGTM